MTSQEGDAVKLRRNQSQCRVAQLLTGALHKGRINPALHSNSPQKPEDSLRSKDGQDLNTYHNQCFPLACSYHSEHRFLDDSPELSSSLHGSHQDTGHTSQVLLISLLSLAPASQPLQNQSPHKKCCYPLGLQLQIFSVSLYFTLLFQSQMMSVTAHSNRALGLSEQMG